MSAPRLRRLILQKRMKMEIQRKLQEETGSVRRRQMQTAILFILQMQTAIILQIRMKRLVRENLLLEAVYFVRESLPPEMVHQLSLIHILYKFRSMEVQEPDKEKGKWTTPHDPRVTPVGRFIRKTSIDEMPQLFNVLLGDMSLVGPRPERPFFVEKFKEEIPRYMIKHQVRPGMTGWAQVNGYRGDTSIVKRIEHDLYYIENWTLGFDFKILFLTFFKGFINKNAY